MSKKKATIEETINISGRKCTFINNLGSIFYIKTRSQKNSYLEDQVVKVIFHLLNNNES
jgi:hypothetical protein